MFLIWSLQSNQVDPLIALRFRNPKDLKLLPYKSRGYSHKNIIFARVHHKIADYQRTPHHRGRDPFSSHYLSQARVKNKKRLEISAFLVQNQQENV